MPHKKLKFKSAAREKVRQGATASADAVHVTLGPKSKCGLFEKKWGASWSAMTESPSQKKWGWRPCREI